MRERESSSELDEHTMALREVFLAFPRTSIILQIISSFTSLTQVLEHDVLI